MPEFIEENADAVRIFYLIRNQVIMGPEGQIIDISHQAIHEAMRLYNVDKPRECFEKVLVMSQNWM